MDELRAGNWSRTLSAPGEKRRHTAVNRLRVDLEKGVIRKSWSNRLPIALIYPSLYRVGMANLGFQLLYSLMNRHPDVVCERFFLSDRSGSDIRTPLRSEESGKPLNAFSVAAFSVSFENDFINVLHILSHNKIPPESSRRGENHPLVMAGGVAVSLNPEPLADFMDFFVLGEAEPIIDRMLEVLVAHARDNAEREKAISCLADLPGIYVPRHYRVMYARSGILRAFTPLGKAPARIKALRLNDMLSGGAASQLHSPEAEFGRMFLVETGRGCGRGCRFCAAGFLYRPPRVVSFQRLKETLDTVPEYLDTVGLVGTALSDHPRLEELCEEILRRGKKVSLSSLRADRVTPRLVSCILASGHRTIALAPEAGTERLRSVLRKGLSEEQILQAVYYLLEGGVPNIRLYFMIGLPTETHADVDAIPSLVRRIRHVFVARSRKHGRIGQITLSISPFVPKPHTPFQWHPFETVQALKAKLKYIQRTLRSIPNVQVHHDVPKWSHIQALLSRGDRRVGRLLLEAMRMSDWARALRAININA
ncbi:MAG: radical SAM protein, partial [Deltaproteobacteria bacterium]|nr:radical SAM protein [Deltaproteobacteria bacterium]